MWTRGSLYFIHFWPQDSLDKRLMALRGGDLGSLLYILSCLIQSSQSLVQLQLMETDVETHIRALD